MKDFSFDFHGKQILVRTIGTTQQFYADDILSVFLGKPGVGINKYITLRELLEASKKWPTRNREMVLEFIEKAAIEYRSNSFALGYELATAKFILQSEKQFRRISEALEKAKGEQVDENKRRETAISENS